MSEDARARKRRFRRKSRDWPRAVEFSSAAATIMTRPKAVSGSGIDPWRTGERSPQRNRVKISLGGGEGDTEGRPSIFEFWTRIRYIRLRVYDRCILGLLAVSMGFTTIILPSGLHTRTMKYHIRVLYTIRNHMYCMRISVINICTIKTYTIGFIGFDVTPESRRPFLFATRLPI